MKSGVVSLERVRELLSYDPESGVLCWRKSRPGISAGPAGSPSTIGYLYVSVDGRKYLAHRLAWLLVHGEWPKHEIDHVDGDRFNNRIGNLRDVERFINNQNRKRARVDNVSSGKLGVAWHEHSQKWGARIQRKGVIYRLGLFDTADEAHSAYVAAKRRIHEGCTI